MTTPNKIEFSNQIAFGDHYPTPKFSTLPKITRKSGSRSRARPSRTSDILFSARARYAWASIAKAELAQEDTVLLPAYHCPAMVEPFMWAGCNIEFYKLQTDLTPDPIDLARLLPQAKAVVFVRFFGIEGKMRALCELAESHKCLIIEDLAHAAFALTLHGHYGVTSLPKFYAVDYGSEIFCRADKDTGKLRHYIESTHRHPVLWNASRALNRLHSSWKVQKTAGIPTVTNGYRYFNAEDMLRPLNERALQQVIQCDDREIIEKRQENYRAIHRIFERHDIGKALYTHADNEFVPYVYPFVLDKAEHFHTIRSAGVPFFRWEELAPTSCQVSKGYHQTLIQIPCHQDLTRPDIELMESAVYAASRAG